MVLSARDCEKNTVKKQNAKPIIEDESFSCVYVR